MGKRRSSTAATLTDLPTADLQRELQRRTLQARRIKRKRDRLQRQIEQIDQEARAVEGGNATDTVRPITERGEPVLRIIRVVAEEYGVPVDDLRSPRRTQSVAQARHICMYLARQHLGYSYEVIGEELGGRDHTTIMYGVEQVERMVSGDPEFASYLQSLVERSGARRE